MQEYVVRLLYVVQYSIERWINATNRKVKLYLAGH